MSTLDTDAIAARLAARLSMRGQHNDGDDDIAALLAEVATLREALRPLASADSLFDPTWPDERGINFIAARFDDTFPELTRGDLRRARRVLEGGA